MPKYVSGPGAMGHEIKTDQPIRWGGPPPTRLERTVMLLFGYALDRKGWLRKVGRLPQEPNR